MGGLPYKNDQVIVVNFEKLHKNFRILFDEHTNSKTTHDLDFDDDKNQSTDNMFQFNTLKGTMTILTVVILDLSTVSGTNLQIWTPKRYDEHPCYFYTGVLPPCLNSLSTAPYKCTQHDMFKVA